MFKIIIQNFGPIQQCEFDLEYDLHLLYGKNSVGKSYAASCIYDLLKNLKNFHVDVNSLSSNERFNSLDKTVIQKLEQLPTLEDDTSKFFDKNSQPVKLKCLNVYSEVVEIAKYSFEHIFLKNIHKSFMNTYTSISNLDNRYANKHFRVSIMLGIYTITFGSKDSQHVELVDFKIDSTVEAVYSNDKDFGIGYYLLTNNGLFLTLSKESFAINVAIYLLADIREHILAGYLDRIYFLPASRSGLYQGLNSLSPIIAELSKSRSVIKSKIELPALSEPVADYFVELSTIEMTQTSNPLQSIVDKIEQSILHGEVQVQSQAKKLVFRPEQTDLILELSGVSSMVAELSPLVAYLKYIIPQKSQASHLLFIEEPEAHLHPEMQVKLMEIFAELAQNGIKIFMTSHSNYMFNKLGNLLLEKKVNSTKTAVYHLVMTVQGSVVSDDMTMSPEGVDDCNFAIVSETLYNERMRLYEQIDQENESFEE